MKTKLLFIGLLFSACLSISCQAPQRTKKAPASLPACEWCGAADAPPNPGWRAEIAHQDEKGEPLYISGIIYQADSLTPAEGILVYVYHTNSQGLYAKKGNETGNGLRHGALRGWMRTDKRGRYAFKTIKPSPYPNRQEPAHIHITLSGKNLDEYWIDETLFAGDPSITDEMLSAHEGEGYVSPIVKLQKNENGILEGKRDIILKK